MRTRYIAALAFTTAFGLTGLAQSAQPALSTDRSARDRIAALSADLHFTGQTRWNRRPGMPSSEGQRIKFAAWSMIS